MSSKPRSVNGLLTSVDSLFTTQAERDDELKPKVEEIALDLIDGFENHPFSVMDDEDMQNLVKSISENGVLVPCIARQNGERYELISGHRRKAACEALGIATLPIIIKDMTREEAIITMVDSNIQREHILPSEKAFAYKMKLEALKHQGTSSQLGTKLRSDEMIAQQTGDSRNQVQRYVRLTNLIPGILKKVDEERIALTPAVELSYLTDAEQEDLLETMESEDCTPSLSQAIQMKTLSQSGQLDMDKIFSIMTQPKANQQEKISFKVSELRDFFPRHYTAPKMMQEIKMALKERQQRLARQRDHSR